MEIYLSVWKWVSFCSQGWYDSQGLYDWCTLKSKSTVFVYSWAYTNKAKLHSTVECMMDMLWYCIWHNFKLTFDINLCKYQIIFCSLPLKKKSHFLTQTFRNILQGACLDWADNCMSDHYNQNLFLLCEWLWYITDLWPVPFCSKPVCFWWY